MAKMITVSATQPKIADFSTAIDGKNTSLHILKNKNGISVGLTNYGARIVSIKVPDAQGNVADVVLGYNTIFEYMQSMEQYFGATIGRYANRIENGQFELDNKSYQLEINDHPNHLHGGVKGYHNVIWDVHSKSASNIIFRYLSEDGDSDYPGSLMIDVSYNLNNKDELVINYSAVSEDITIINLTNHAYFNLSGSGSGKVDKHLVYIDADSFTPINSKMIPTNEILKVENTPFDFRIEKEIGESWDSENNQIQIAGGFDHNFILNKADEGVLQLAARVTDPESGRTLEVDTTEPGLQFYTSNALTGLDIGREGIAYNARSAFCLESQHYPNSPNRLDFPSVILEPGKKYKSTTVYRFKY